MIRACFGSQKAIGTNRPRAQRQANSGFTLFELLPVVAILVLLAGILFPVFSEGENLVQETYVETVSGIATLSLLEIDPPPFGIDPPPFGDALLTAASEGYDETAEDLERAAAWAEWTKNHLRSDVEGSLVNVVVPAIDLDEDGFIDEDEYRTVVGSVEDFQKFSPPEGQTGTGSVSVEDAKRLATAVYSKKQLLKYIEDPQAVDLARGERTALKALFRGAGNEVNEFGNFHKLVEKLYLSHGSKMSHETRLKLHIAGWIGEF